MEIKVRVPGKLVLAGEWSVLEPGNSCIAIPVNKFVEVEIESCDQFVFNAPQMNLDGLVASFKNGIFEWTHGNFNLQKAELARVTLQTVLNYVVQKQIKIRPVTICVKSELSRIDTITGKELKPGLGSSAATAVAITKAVLMFFEQKVEALTVFKLAAIAHYLFQQKIGSGVDVAVSAFECPIIYKRFDENWLQEELAQRDLVATVDSVWPGLKIEPLTFPKDLIIVTGFSGISASTTQLSALVQRARKLHPDLYKQIISEIDSVVLQLVPALQHGHQDLILHLIRQNRVLLKKLSDHCNEQLEIPLLAQLISAAELSGGAAKFSGAGGGDCCIALCFNVKTATQIKEAWKQMGCLVF